MRGDAGCVWRRSSSTSEEEAGHSADDRSKQSVRGLAIDHAETDGLLSTIVGGVTGYFFGG